MRRHLQEFHLMWVVGRSRVALKKTWTSSISPGAECTKTLLSPEGIWLYSKTSFKEHTKDMCATCQMYNYIEGERFSINQVFVTAVISVLKPQGASFCLHFHTDNHVNLRGCNDIKWMNCWLIVPFRAFKRYIRLNNFRRNNQHI